MTLIKSSFPALTDFFSDDWMTPRLRNGGSVPAVNVVDNDKNYEIEVAAPGFEKNDFKVMVENGVLNVKGETSKEKEEEGKNYTRKEFSKRSFSKSFTLPENVKNEEVSAKYSDGILRLILEKTEPVTPLKKEILID